MLIKVLHELAAKRNLIIKLLLMKFRAYVFSSISRIRTQIPIFYESFFPPFFVIPFSLTDTFHVNPQMQIVVSEAQDVVICLSQHVVLDPRVIGFSVYQVCI